MQLLRITFISASTVNTGTMAKVVYEHVIRLEVTLYAMERKSSIRVKLLCL